MKTVALSMTLAIGWLIAGAVIASDACKPAAECGAVGCESGQCGQECGCCPKCGAKMCCQLICVTKEVKKTVWTCKSEPFCAPLPGCRRDCGYGESGNNCCPEEKACGDAGCGNGGKKCGPCAVEEAKRQVPPKCTKVRCKNVLVKKEVVCKVPTYKCVPVCPNCGCGGQNGGCEGSQGMKAPSKKSEKAPAPAPAPSKTTLEAPMPPVMNTSFVK